MSFFPADYFVEIAFELSSRDMDKAYSPDLHDKKWQQFWKARDLFRPETAKSKHARPSGKTYTVMMPPPNVTGVLHQGHALFLTMEDTLVRWRRMKGDETLYLPGTDHAAIAVQLQVVKQLESQGISYQSLGREGFLEKCWEWIREYQPRIYQQVEAMGASCDWSRVKFTMEPDLNAAVTRAFVQLYQEGLIYRAERLVNWSPKGQTGLSDLEVIYEEREGSLWHLRYPIVGSQDPAQKYLVVATTRPETMLGDTAVAVNPHDARYRDLVGKKIRLPIVNREIPIIADTFVDQEFGSGVVKITPAHDHNDFECGQRHQLPFVRVLDKEAKVIANLGGEANAWAGLSREQARVKVVEWFEQNGLLEKIEKHRNRVGLAERSGDIVEPYLSYQWYVKIAPLAEPALKAVRDQEIRVVPHEFHNQYLRWMEGIHDWCISRQLWWGHAIPAYHCQSCSHIEVSEAPVTSCPRCQSQMSPDPDVLDTWFSSGLWPFSTLGWPNERSADFQKFYPTQVLETGFDILFFWVARMIMMGMHFTKRVPFDRVYLHPIVRDAKGQKMSKSKGNVIDPLEIVEKNGADTLRFSLSALCAQGRDMNLSLDRVEGYRHFMNKVWNAVRFVTMGEPTAQWRERPKPQHLHDRWILTRLDEVARDVDKSWSEFRMQEAADAIYHFVWNDFCDWYLECVKGTRAQSQVVALHVVGEILKLLHPVCPHLTEELYHQLPGVSPDESIMVATFPEGANFPDADSLAEFRFFQSVVNALRGLRSENKVKPQKTIEVFCGPVDRASREVLQHELINLKALVKVSDLRFDQSGPERSTKVVVPSLVAGQNLELFVGLADLVDVGDEVRRLEGEVEKLSAWIRSQTGKLSNENFVKNAPFEVVEKERIKLQESEDRLRKLQDSLKLLTQ